MTAFQSAEAKIREAVTKAAAVSSDARLKELAQLGEPTAPRARAIVKDAFGSADPTDDLASLQSILMTLHDEVHKLGLHGTMDRAAIPMLIESIERHTVVAVRSLQRSLQPPAGKNNEQGTRSMFTEQLADAILALTKHVETLNEIPTR